MLGERQRREALGLGLIVAGLLMALAVLSPVLAGPDRNLIGPAGGLLETGLSFLFGPLAVLAALPPLVWGVHFLGVGERGQALPAGLLLVLPTFVWLALARETGSAEGVGWLGGALGGALQTAFGWVGALLIAVALLGVTLVLTLGWSLAQAVVGGGRLARQGLKAGAGGARPMGRVRSRGPRGSRRRPRRQRATIWSRTSNPHPPRPGRVRGETGRRRRRPSPSIPRSPTPETSTRRRSLPSNSSMSPSAAARDWRPGTSNVWAAC